MDNSRKRYQYFTDPRTSKIRSTIRKLSQELNEINRLDPKLKTLKERIFIPFKEKRFGTSQTPRFDKRVIELL